MPLPKLLRLSCPKATGTANRTRRTAKRSTQKVSFHSPSAPASANTVIAAAKKKNAIDELAKIEKKFKVFREK